MNSGHSFLIFCFTDFFVQIRLLEDEIKKKKNLGVVYFLACLLILIKKGGLLQLKFGVVGVGVGVNIYLWAR